jgi:threonyl-tRNA synthetase
VITINDTHNPYAESLVEQLQAVGVRASADTDSGRMNAKIRKAQLMKVPYMLVVGEREMANNAVALRRRDGQQENDLPFATFLERVRERIITRSAEL